MEKILQKKYIYMYTKQKRYKKKRLVANTTFDKKTAQQFSDMRYYIAQQDYIKSHELIEREKRASPGS